MESIMYRKMTHYSLMAIFVISGCGKNEAKISLDERMIDTYKFSDPNPIPVLTSDKRLYPYHKFYNYSHTSEKQKWNVVTMENEHIAIYVLPEVGGKVWGAIDKSNNQEFIYRNEVMKFRNIALRGPWTSGGIEFNFGIIGHTPATATPVDYLTRKNSDGSVSTFIGGMDLPSRSVWRVEINLEKNRSNFKTKTNWYNATQMVQPYYNWMTGAAFASEDLELIFPGDKYLMHSGEVKDWPIDKSKRNLSLYRNNNFGGHKSYHVVGSWKNFFGGYYHNDGYGFGHWSNHDEMPGQKLWLWSLSDMGGIWEDHLTDSDGQYIEFQAGRQFVQYREDSANNNPIRKASFEPYVSDQWEEYWFPVQKIGGISDASKNGVMNVEEFSDSITIKIHSFIPKKGTVTLSSNSKTLLSENIGFEPMKVHKITYKDSTIKDYEIKVSALNLYATTNAKSLALSRQFKLKEDYFSSMSQLDREYFNGYELLKERRYDKARTIFENILDKNPNHHSSRIALSDLMFRSSQHKKGLELIEANLQLNTYNPDANFIAGNHYRALKMNLDAKESFGWAARSMKYRSAAYLEMSEIYLLEENTAMAIEYAQKALSFNERNYKAREVLAIAHRLSGKDGKFRKEISILLEQDPLHHFAHLEKAMLSQSNKDWDRYFSLIRNEYANQIHLENAISYYNRGLNDSAISLLEKINGTKIMDPITRIWYAYISRDPKLLNSVETASIDYSHPFRRETISTLEWAVNESSHWKFSFLLALNLWAKDRNEDAWTLMKKLEDIPDSMPFYLSRSNLAETFGTKNNVEKDLRRSLDLGKDSWIAMMFAVQYFQTKGNWKTAETISSQAYEKFPDNFNVRILHSKSLLYNNKIDECIEILNSTKVLPSEMGKESRQLHEWAHLTKAIDLMKERKLDSARKSIDISRAWPKNLGIGKPFDTDEKLQNILVDYINNPTNSAKYRRYLETLGKGSEGYNLLVIKKAQSMMKALN